MLHQPAQWERLTSLYSQQIRRLLLNFLHTNPLVALLIIKQRPRLSSTLPSKAATIGDSTPAAQDTTTTMNAQTHCYLFRLPRELRDIVYGYVLSRKDLESQRSGQRPVVDLYNQHGRCAPSNELLRTCRRVYDEGKDTFRREQRRFWSDSVFTICLVKREPHNEFFVDFPTRVNNAQFDNITRLRISMQLIVQHAIELTHDTSIHGSSGFSISPCLNPLTGTDYLWLSRDISAYLAYRLAPDNVFRTCCDLRRSHYLKTLSEKLNGRSLNGREPTALQREKWEQETCEETGMLRISQKSRKRLEVMVIVDYLCSLEGVMMKCSRT